MKSWLVVDNSRDVRKIACSRSPGQRGMYQLTAQPATKLVAAG